MATEASKNDIEEQKGLLSRLGIDVEGLRWQDLSLCVNTPTNHFYDDYESDVQVASVIDEMCTSCPVMTQCLKRGVENNEQGVWGGVYLTNGKPDSARNAHKTPEVWAALTGNVTDG